MLPPKTWAQTQNLQCCKSGSRIRDQGSGVFLISGFGIRDPVSGSGKGKKSGSGSGIRTRDGKPWSYFWELRNHFFWLKYLNSLMCIRDPGSVMEKIQIWDQGYRMEKIWIQDPGWKKIRSGIQDPGLNIPDQQNWKFRCRICYDLKNWIIIEPFVFSSFSVYFHKTIYV